MFPDSRTESSPIKFIHKAEITFLSKVLLRLLNQDQKLQFRKLEAITKKFSKLEAEIKYIYYNNSFQLYLIPKYVMMNPFFSLTVFLYRYYYIIFIGTYQYICLYNA